MSPSTTGKAATSSSQVGPTGPRKGESIVPHHLREVLLRGSHLALARARGVPCVGVVFLPLTSVFQLLGGTVFTALEAFLQNQINTASPVLWENDFQIAQMPLRSVFRSMEPVTAGAPLTRGDEGGSFEVGRDQDCKGQGCTLPVGGRRWPVIAWNQSPLPNGISVAIHCCVRKGCRISKKGWK